jgi:hypothetical protein
MAAKIQFRRDEAIDWVTANPILSEGEIGLELDTGFLKIGDGITHWNALLYAIKHASLSDLQGGAIGEHYHLTAAEQSNLHAPGSDDQVLTGLFHSNREALDVVTGTNSGDHAYNSLYAGSITAGKSVALAMVFGG